MGARSLLCRVTVSLIALLLVLAACQTPTLPPTPTPTPTLTLTPTATATPIPTPTPAPTLLPTSTPTPTPTPEPDPPDAGALLTEPPPRPFDYIVVNAEPPRRVPNATRRFWVTGATGRKWEVSARLRVQTDHVAMWVEEGVWHDVRFLEEAAAFFEAQVYSTTRAAFGSEWTPGVDNDSHLHILHAAGLGRDVLGYTSSADEFPRFLYPFSNEAEMITVNVETVDVGSPAYYTVLAREFQRLIQWSYDRNEARWVKDGLAELAVHLNGVSVGRPEWFYGQRPDVPLTAFDGKDAASQWGGAYLFAVYFHERFGDEGTRALVAQPLNGIAGVEATLAELGADLTSEDLFAEWLAANYLDAEPGGSTSPYGYATLDLERPALAAVCESYPITVEATVHPFGADYILLRGDGDLRVRFAGEGAVPLLDITPHSGSYFWWSNRADESLTTLTRAFDLSGVQQATLTYWAWYDIEQDYDYALVEVSSDGGQSWQVLQTTSGMGDDPHGNNPGWGYTGQSGDWVQEQVDLTAYVGGEVLVRFAYLTDGATTGAGFLLDDVAVPEIGYAEDFEGGDGGWEAAGFLRSNNLVDQRYLALLIGLGDGPTVERLALAEDQTAEWTVPLGSQGWREAVLVLSGLAPLTSYPAPYRLTIEHESSQ